MPVKIILKLALRLRIRYLGQSGRGAQGAADEKRQRYKNRGKPHRLISPHGLRLGFARPEGIERARRRKMSYELSYRRFRCEGMVNRRERCDFSGAARTDRRLI